MNAIAPGYISTDVSVREAAQRCILTSCQMNEALIADPVRSKQILERIPAGRWGTPDDFEGAIVFLASRASDYISGECLTVDGGWMGRECSWPDEFSLLITNSRLNVKGCHFVLLDASAHARCVGSVSEAVPPSD